MDEMIRKITCDKCDNDVGFCDRWELEIDNWSSDGTHTYWKADLCPECKVVLISAIFNLDIKLRYTKE